MYFCDTMFEGVGKTPIFGDRGGKEGYFTSKLCDVNYKCPRTLSLLNQQTGTSHSIPCLKSYFHAFTSCSFTNGRQEEKAKEKGCEINLLPVYFKRYCMFFVTVAFKKKKM